MSPGELQHLGGRLAALFPKSDWTPDLFKLLGKRVANVSIGFDQIDAVVEEYRLRTRLRSPVLRDIVERLQAAHGVARRNQAAVDMTQRPADDSGQYRANPTSATHVAANFGRGVKLIPLREYMAQHGDLKLPTKAPAKAAEVSP